MSDWSKEFYEKFEAPHINSLTVGFSSIDPSTRGITPSEIPHEELGSLLGGDENGHFHLTAEELAKLNSYPDSIKHETLPDLQGGAESEHYHLTAEELDKLQNIENMLVNEDDGTVEIPAPIPDHEALNNLKGGLVNEHYHFSLSEWTKLLKLIDALFPNGATEPVFPGVPSGDDPSGGESSVDMWGGLPKGIPPQWSMYTMPYYSGSKSYHPHTNPKMYFGRLPKNSVTSEGLLVPMRETKSSGELATPVYWVYTTNSGLGPSSWDKITSLSSEILGNKISQYLPRKYNDYYYLFVLAEQLSNEKICRLYNGVVGYLTYSDYSGVDGWTAGCYSPTVDGGVYLFVSVYGYSQKMLATKNQTTKAVYSMGGNNINPGCVAWSPDRQIFCASGASATFISSNGEQWVVHGNSLNLQDLCYREDLSCFFARGGNDNRFYVSGDGINWQRYPTGATSIYLVGDDGKVSREFTDRGVPLDTVTAVDFSRVDGNGDRWYCAIGGTSNYVYFSKDLVHWRSTKIANGAAIAMGDVIWAGGNINKYVLMTTSGTNFYVFNPAEWKDN